MLAGAPGATRPTGSVAACGVGRKTAGRYHSGEFFGLSILPRSPHHPRRGPALRDLADKVLEVADLPALKTLLTGELPGILGLDSATLLLWDRKLESFESLAAGETPEARFLISDAQLHEMRAGGGEGALLPLLARGGVVGMLRLGRRRGRRRQPYKPGELKLLSQLAARAALAIENHLYHQELIASERMAALGTLAGMLAHDFRGPMTVIRGTAETLTLEPLSSEELRQRTALITQMVDRLERMTVETLDFARGAGKLARRPVALRRFLDELAAELPRELPGLTLTTEFALPETSAALDADKLRRAIGNVASNARDAMKGSGRLALGARLEDGWLVLDLADDGPGIPAEIRDRVFEPFVSQGKKGGTGLGLAVARRFVEDHGGSIELLPEGPGARFRIRLPLEPVAPA